MPNGKIPRKARRVVRKRAARAVKKPPVSVAVKKYVKSAMSKQIENKTVSVEQNVNFGSVAASGVLNAFPMLPLTGFFSLGQGVTQGTRIGNRCKIKKVTLNYTLIPTAYNVTTNVNAIPNHIIMYLGTPRSCPGEYPTTGDISLLYQLGASAVAPTGTLSDLIYNINNDEWDMKKVWTHKLGPAASEWNGGQSTSQYYTNNDFALNVVRRMNITKYCQKTMKFSDGLSSHQGKNLFFMFQAIYANGTAAGATQLTTNIRYFVTIDYEDA